MKYKISFLDATQSLFYVLIGTSPMLFPLCLFFSIFSTYHHLSLNFEMTAFRSLGFNLFQITFPALLLGLLVFPFLLQSSLYLSPWSNRKLEFLLQSFKKRESSFVLPPATFTESLPNVVIYANKVNEKKGFFEEIFIYDESQSLGALTVVAEKAQVKKSKDNQFFLQLFKGQVHKRLDNSHTSLDFDSYDLYLVSKKSSSFSPLAYNVEELKEEMKKTSISEKRKRRLLIAYHRLWAFPVAGFLFTLLGMGLGTFYIRPFKMSGFVLCSFVVSIYFAFYVTFENLAKHLNAPVGLLIWATNFLLFIPLVWSFRRLKF